MTITAITCTYQRPAALALCRAYMARQTRQPDQWIILDGPEKMQEKVLTLCESGRIITDAVLFFEDDDLFRSDWIEWCVAQLAKGYDLVGEGNAVYYHVGHRWWSECRNVRHAALCQTAIKTTLLPVLANCIRSSDHPFFDTLIWRVNCNKFLAMPANPTQRRVIGIKGIKGEGGTTGYSGEHREAAPAGTHADPSLLRLWQWAGPDAANYSKFKESTS